MITIRALIETIHNHNYPNQVILTNDDYGELSSKIAMRFQGYDENGRYLWVNRTQIRPQRVRNVVLDLTNAEEWK